jgi:hypothetical protein
MQIFTTTLGQMAVLFSLIIIGYLLATKINFGNPFRKGKFERKTK